MHLPGIASYRLPPGGGEVTAIPDPSAGSQRVASAFQRTVLPMAVQVAGREVLHASAVRTAAGVVAFCGVSTTGKSTIARELSRRGYDLWADDAVAFDTRDGRFISLPLPFQLQDRPPSDLEENGLPPTPLSGAAGIEASVPLGAVCVLERATELGDGVARIRQLEPGEAFPAVLAHAYCYSLDDVERNRAMIEHYLDLSGHVPIFSVVFRAGLGHLPAVIEAVEQRVGMAPSRAS